MHHFIARFKHPICLGFGHYGNSVNWVTSAANIAQVWKLGRPGGSRFLLRAFPQGFADVWVPAFFPDVVEIF